MEIDLRTHAQRRGQRAPGFALAMAQHCARAWLVPLALLVGICCVPAMAQVQAPSFITSVWNPEDLVRLPGTPWVVVSGMPSKLHKGRLFIVDVRDPRAAMPFYPAAGVVPGGPDPELFFPHGLDVRPLGEGRFELLVVNHGGGESIAHFHIEARDGEPPVIHSVSRTDLPLGAWANGVVALADAGFAITSMFDPRDQDFIAKFSAAEPTGGVWRWSPGMGWKALAAPQLSGGNGIAVSRDGRTLFAAEWAARRVWRMALDGSQARSVSVTFLPDNLRWTDQGQLLIAGQTSEPQKVFACEQDAGKCPMGFQLVTVDPETLEVHTVLDAGEEMFRATGFGGATGALQVGEQIWVGSFTGERIASFARCLGDCPRPLQAQEGTQ